MKIHPAAWSLFLLLAVGLVVLGVRALRPSTTEAPDFAIPTTGNETFTLSAHRGAVVILDFFATYCADCSIIEKNLKEAQTAWTGANVTIVSIGVAPFETLEDLRAYQARHNLTWTVARDEADLAKKYSAFELGRVVIVDAFGRVVFAKSGSWQITTDAVRETVLRSLQEGQAPVELAQYSLWGLAVVSAIASFFSPCAIGLLPGYVAHTVRSGADPNAPAWGRAWKMGTLAAAGLLLVFLGIGGLAFLVGDALTRYVPWFGPLVGVVLILVGLLLILRPFSLLLQRFFSPLTQITSGSDEPVRGGASYFLYGLGYGAGAAGCTAPVLFGLVATAAAFGATHGVLFILLYAGVAALLMVILTLIVAGSRAAAAGWIQRNGRRVELLSAILFMAGGAFLLWYANRAGTLPV